MQKDNEINLVYSKVERKRSGRVSLGKCKVNDSGTNNICLNSVHSPTADAVSNSTLSLEGGITRLVNRTNDTRAPVSGKEHPKRVKKSYPCFPKI